MNPAADLIEEAGRHRVVLVRYGDAIKLRAPAEPPADFVARLRERKRDLLNILPDLSRPDPVARAVVGFRFPGYPANSWATCLGAPGETRAKVIGDIFAKWPDAEVQP